MALRPWKVSRHEISLKPEPSLSRGSQNWLSSCYKPEYLVLSSLWPVWGLSAIVAGCVHLVSKKPVFKVRDVLVLFKK